MAGPVGDAATGLDILTGQRRAIPAEKSAYFVRRFFEHKPLFKESQALADEPGVTAAMDLSDSLIDCIQLLCEASHVGAHAEVNAIPLSNSYKAVSDPSPSLLAAGEDYGLLFTAKPSCLPRLRKKLKFSVVGWTKKKSAGIRYFWNGRPVAPPASFQHF